MNKTSELIAKLVQEHNERVQILKDNSETLNVLYDAVGSTTVGSFEPSNSSINEFDINFAGKKDDFERFWKTLRNLGYEPNRRPGAEPTPNFATCWTKEGSQLRIWMYFSSKECKLVQKGTKMVEQPVYEVQCSAS